MRCTQGWEIQFVKILCILIISVIDAKAATVTLEIFSVFKCTHITPERGIGKRLLIPYSNFFTVQRQTPLRSQSLFVSYALFQLQFCLQQNSLTYLSFLNPAWVCRRLHMLHLRGGCVLLDWVMNALTLTPLFTVKCLVARLNVTGYASSQTQTCIELLLFLLQWSLWIKNGYMMETQRSAGKP